MSTPHRQSVAQISAVLGIHIVTLYNWRKAWRLPGEVVPASEKDPDGWSAADLASRHNCETRCDRTGLSRLGGQGAVRAWGCQTKPSPRSIPCSPAC